MRIQTDREFEQNEIKKLNKKCNVHMFSSRDFGSKAFAPEQKIKEFKKLLFKTKSLKKKLGKRIRPNKLIEKATSYLNKMKIFKYGVAVEKIESKSVENDQFGEKYDFYRLQK